MNWDDLRFVSAVVRHGSLLRAARELGVEHTTVGRRIDAAERALGVRLFARSTAGFTLTADGERLLAPLQQVEDAILGLERRASAEGAELIGTVKVTAPETFGISWLAPRLALFARQHPGLVIDLDPVGAVLDLNRGEAELAVRFFQTPDKGLIVRRVADVGHGLYATRAWLARYPVRGPADLTGRHVVTGPNTDSETQWLHELAPEIQTTFTSPLSLVLAAAARAGAGIAILPRYLGDADPELEYVPMPNEPRDTLWLTVHRDLRTTPRVRAVMDFLIDQFEREASTLRGRVF